jgi:thymidylate synthase (FAD)
MLVTLLDYMSSDLDVVNAARVSFNKESEWEYDEGGEDENGKFFNKVLSASDEKLIKYLAEHKHWSPFSHPQISFRIKAPIFVARQLAKHQIGFAWNEVSRRYVDFEPEFYTPETWRKKADNKKQGSSDEIVEWPFYHESQIGFDGIDFDYESLISLTKAWYTHAVEKCKVCPEQARMILPQSMYTEWVWTGSLYAFARMLNLRLKEDTQKETREIASKIHEHLVELFPVSLKYLLKTS